MNILTVQETRHVKKLIDASVIKEVKLRTALVSELEGVSQKSDHVQVQTYVIPNFRSIYEFLNTQRVESIPDLNYIQPIEAKIYTQEKDSAPTLVVLFDIILDTLGMALQERDVIKNSWKQKGSYRIQLKICWSTLLLGISGRL